jgi:hypothetical protein
MLHSAVSSNVTTTRSRCNRFRSTLLALAAVLVSGASFLIAGVSSSDQPSVTAPSVSAIAQLSHTSVGRAVVYLDDSETHTRLEPDTDYLVVLPDGPKFGATVLEGGRDILIDGGHIVMEWARSDIERRALYIKNASGTVRIQNLFIEGVDGAVFDAIAISAPDAVVQLANIRVEGVRGTFAGFHGDIVQPFGGVKRLVVDGLTGRSSYQGFYLQETSGSIGSVVLRNVNLAYDENPEDDTTFLLWLDGCSTYPVTLRNVYIDPRDGQSVSSHAVRPNDVRPKDCRAVQDGDEVSWPRIPEIDGKVISGTPVAGDFVPRP